MIASIGFAGSSVGLRHALAFASELHRRVVINKEHPKRVARSLELDHKQVVGVARLLRAVPTLSPERAALIVMRDPGLDDSDIAEIFGRSRQWARVVRERGPEIRVAEPVPERLEWFEGGPQKDDPTPEEISARAAELRRTPNRVRAPESRHGIPTYQWNGHAFISIGAY